MIKLTVACPKCSSPTKVTSTDYIHGDDGGKKVSWIRRYRCCQNCKYKFATKQETEMIYDTTIGHCGENHPSSVLTEENVKEMREKYAAGQGTSSIAREMGLEPSHVSRVCLRKTWKHVA